MLSRVLRFCFTTHQHKNIHPAEITAKMTDIRKNISQQQEELTLLRKQIKEKEVETAAKNKNIQDKRIKLMEDIKKSEQVWADAKQKSEANKSAAIHNFADSLVGLGIHFNSTKTFQTPQHSTDLREGFDNTVRLFLNTLQKFKIKQIEINQGTKVKRDSVEVKGEEKSEKPEQKDTIAKIVEVGWQVEGKVIRKPKVILYV